MIGATFLAKRSASAFTLATARSESRLRVTVPGWELSDSPTTSGAIGSLGAAFGFWDSQNLYGAASLVLLVAANRSGVWRGPMPRSVVLIFAAAARYDPKGFDELQPWHAAATDPERP